MGHLFIFLIICWSSFIYPLDTMPITFQTIALGTHLWLNSVMRARIAVILSGSQTESYEDKVSQSSSSCRHCDEYSHILMASPIPSTSISNLQNNQSMINPHHYDNSEFSPHVWNSPLYQWIFSACMKPAPLWYQWIFSACMKPTPLWYQGIFSACMKPAPLLYQRIFSACMSACRRPDTGQSAYFTVWHTQGSGVFG